MTVFFRRDSMSRASFQHSLIHGISEDLPDYSRILFRLYFQNKGKILIHLVRQL